MAGLDVCCCDTDPVRYWRCVAAEPSFICFALLSFVCLAFFFVACPQFCLACVVVFSGCLHRVLFEVRLWSKLLDFLCFFVFYSLRGLPLWCSYCLDFRFRPLCAPLCCLNLSALFVSGCCIGLLGRCCGETWVDCHRNNC